MVWSPLVARCTEMGGMVLALIGICGLATFLARPHVILNLLV